MDACRGLFIRYKPIAVGQAQADGMVERVNRTLLHVASTICSGDETKWAQYIGEIEYALNTRVSSVAGHSPYELVYGRLPPGPSYTNILNSDPEGRRADENVRVLRNRIQVLQQLAHENQMQAAKGQISYHDARARAHRFQVGDMVWYYRASSLKRGQTSKLAYKWKGPYVIAKVLGPVTYTLRDKEGKILPGVAVLQDK